ncbi:hypothetical protein LguiA_022959 [Lonicera macranthoides]
MSIKYSIFISLSNPNLLSPSLRFGICFKLAVDITQMRCLFNKLRGLEQDPSLTMYTFIAS